MVETVRLVIKAGLRAQPVGIAKVADSAAQMQTVGTPETPGKVRRDLAEIVKVADSTAQMQTVGIPGRPGNVRWDLAEIVKAADFAAPV